MANAASSLDSRNWITDPLILLDRLIAYYTAANFHQSLIFRGKVFSLQRAIFDCGQDMDQLANRIQSDLEQIMTRNFPEGNTVEVNYVSDPLSAKVDMQIGVSVIQNGAPYELQRAVSTTDSIFRSSQSAVGVLPN